MFGKKTTTELDNQMAVMMNELLAEIYSNKSSDEYKQAGDITKSTAYETMEQLIADLSSLKRYSPKDAEELKKLFNVLHRPIFPKMVKEYLVEPNDRNTIFTAVYTVGFRVCVAELSRIFVSTEATSDGLIYKPNKISRHQDLGKFIAVYNDDLESRIDREIKRAAAEKPVQEVETGAVADILRVAGNFILSIGDVLAAIWGVINPISLIGASLSRHYDGQVNRLQEIRALYEESKIAYDQYKKKPASDRLKKVEDKYVANIEKYNIQMRNLEAKIAHYDQRAQEEAKDRVTRGRGPETIPSTEEITKKGEAPAEVSPATDDFDF